MSRVTALNFPGSSSGAIVRVVGTPFSLSSSMRSARLLRPALPPLSIRPATSLRSHRAASTSAFQDKDPQLGDYPDLPWQSSQTLPPRGWWDQQMRRNFADPVPECEEVLSMWGPDIPVVPPRTALFQFALAASAFVGFGFLCKHLLVPDRPTVPREYPYSGLVKELGGLEENKAREEIEDDQE